MDQLDRRVERIEQEHQVIAEALRRIESLVMDETQRREALEQQVDDLKACVAGLQAPIEEIERALRR